MTSTNPRILPAPSRPMDDSTPGSPVDAHFNQTASTKRKPELSHVSTKKRARVSYSCQECHRRKQKCDRQVPCGHCVARKVPELCKNYQPGKTEDFNARLSRIEQIIDIAFPQYAMGDTTMPSSPREGETSFSGTLPSAGLNGAPWPGAVPGGINGARLMDLDHMDDNTKSPASSRSESPKPEGPDPSGGMLASGKWFGTSALGSVNSRPIFEQLQPATGGIQPIIDEAAEVNDKLKSLIQDYGVAPHKLSELVQELPPRSLSDVLIDYYFSSVNYTRYPLYEPTFRSAYENICNNGVLVHPNDIRFLPLLFVVLAIAARLAPENILGDDRSKRMSALRYYWASRRSILIAASVHTDSFELILTRLLSVRFLTFDRRITECWAQLGAAVRTAQAIGLHRDPAKLGLDAFQTEYRRRVWAYLYHADSTFALLLGRPRVIHDSYTDTLSPLNIDDDEMLEHVKAWQAQMQQAQQPVVPQPMQGHSRSTPTYTTFTILRHELARIMGHIVHHFQLVRHHSHYNEVLALEEELQSFIRNLPPQYGLEPDTSLDEKLEYIPVHRFLIITEVFFVRISLHRPYILRKLDSDRYAPSRRACFESARKDFQVRQAFKKAMPQRVIDAMGGAYREFQSAMISGIALVIDPHGPESPAMHQILENFLLEHGIGEGAPPMLKEVDETTKRELKIIEFLSQKAKEVEAQGPRTVTKKAEGEDESEEGDGSSSSRYNGEQVSAERSSMRAKRKKPSRTDFGLPFGLSGGVNQSGTGTPTAVASTNSPFGRSHSRTPSAITIPRPGISGSPLTRTPVDSPSPKFGPQPNPANISPSYSRQNPPSHATSPRLVDLAQRQDTGVSLGSSSPSGEDPSSSAQRLLDNWYSSVHTLDAGSANLGGFDSSIFGGMFGPAAAAPHPGGPMWGVPMVNGGLGLMTAANNPSPGEPSTSGGSTSVPPTELPPTLADGADYMYWDALVQHIRGGAS